MAAFQTSTWLDIETLRQAVMGGGHESVEEAAQAFARQLSESYASVVLARVFLVLPFASLPAAEQAAALAIARGDERMIAKTPVLALLGSYGQLAAWQDRKQSRGHLAIPLLSREHVQGIPMIAKLLADLEVNLAGLDDGKPIATRRMLGGRNGAFFVPDSASTQDDAGRHIIPAQDFVREHQVRTVFGMGGAYANGTLAVVVIFTNETIDRAVVDRYPSVISNFKMATDALLSAGRVYRAGANAAP